MIATRTWERSSGSAFRSANTKTGVADLRFYNAAYCEWGQGEPLILLPGLAGGFELLGPLAGELSRHYRVISLHYRGETDCFALRRRFGLRDLVTDIREFIDWLGLERPYVCGVSFGGLLALEYAAAFPNRVAALAVQGVGARFERGLIQRIASLVLSAYPLPTNSPFVNQFFNLLFGGPHHRPLFEFVTHQCWQTDQSVMAHRLHLIERHDLAARVRELSVPTCVLGGDRDFLVSSQSLSRLSAALTSGQCESLDGCGHLAFVTHPQLVAARIRAFLSTEQSDAEMDSFRIR